MHHRRSFLSSLSLVSLLPSAVISAAERARPALLVPNAIVPGSTIGVVCPASAVTTRDISPFIALCTSLGLRVRLGSNVNNRSGYLAASDQARADEFMRFVEDDTVDAIVCARGGYGVMRILPSLDFGAIRDARKIVMGFSDITALLIAIEQQSRLVSFHGPVASSSFDAFTRQSFVSTLFRNGWANDAARAPRDLANVPSTDITTIVPGVARGRITGGNLSMVISTLGTQYEIDTTDAILILEEVSEEPYRIDRMLTQLWLAGKLQTCKAILLGNFRDCEARGSSRVPPGRALMQVLKDRLANLGIPVLYGMPFGHVKSKLTLPIGTLAELDSATGRLTILQSPLSV